MRQMAVAFTWSTIALVPACGRRQAAPPTPSTAAVAAHEDSIITSDSVKLWYRVVGRGQETVIVPFALYHAKQLDGLAHGRRLVLYDPRGRGRSDTVPTRKVSLDANLRDVEAIRVAVGAERVALIGWSGAGMEMFVYTLRHPGRVTRLVQLAPVAPRWIPYSSMMMADRARRTDTAAARALANREAKGEFVNDPAALCRARNQVYRPATFGDTAVMSATPDECADPTEWPPRIGQYFGALLSSIEGFDWRDSLSRVSRVPRLVIHGERDNTPLEGNREWVAGQPNARLLVIPTAGHWPHYERPELTIPAIDRFLRGQWPAGSEGDTSLDEARDLAPTRL